MTISDMAFEQVGLGGGEHVGLGRQAGDSFCYWLRAIDASGQLLPGTNDGEKFRWLLRFGA